MMKRSSILKSERLKSASSDVLFIFAKIKTWQKIEKFKKSVYKVYINDEKIKTPLCKGVIDKW